MFSTQQQEQNIFYVRNRAVYSYERGLILSIFKNGGMNTTHERDHAVYWHAEKSITRYKM